MLNKPSCSLLALCVVLLAGCVAALPMKEAPSTAPPTTSFIVSDKLPTGRQKYSFTDLQGTYFGSSGGTGSVAVGLMFGAIGALANAEYVESVNRKRAVPLAALTSTDLGKLLKQQLATIGQTGVNASQAYMLTPAAGVSFSSDTTYELSCTVTAELPAIHDQAAWRARYRVAVDGVFDSTRADDTATASNALGPCLLEAYNLFKGHVEGKFGPFEHRTISISVVGDNDIDMEVQEAVSQLPAKVIVQDTLGLNELKFSAIKQAR